MASRLSVFSGIFLASALLGACVDTSEEDADAVDLDAGAGGADGAVDGDSGSGGGAGVDATQAPEGFSCGTLQKPERVVMGYVPTWSWSYDEMVNGLDYDTLTHVAIAFAIPEGGVLSFGIEDEKIASLVTQAHAKGVKVLGSLAGADDSALVRQSLDPEDVDAFVAQLAAFVKKHDLDGIDVDIEGGSVDQTYTPFVTKLAAADSPDGKLLTAALQRQSWDNVDDHAMWCFDFVSSMTYDYAGTWGDPGEHSTLSQARADLSYWADEREFPPSRVVLGLPFYGYCWGSGCTDGYTSFSSIAAAFPDKINLDWISTADQEISFNGTGTITKKVELANDFGGVMIWEMSQDDSAKSLWTALKAGL